LSAYCATVDTALSYSNETTLKGTQQATIKSTKSNSELAALWGANNDSFDSAVTHANYATVSPAKPAAHFTASEHTVDATIFAAIASTINTTLG
jgi:hypothetical protein